MINMNIFFEFVSMILKNHMFKINLNRFKKLQIYIYIFTFLVNGHLKFTYALSTFEIILIIYQSSNVKIFLNTIPLVNFKNIFDLLLVH